MRPNFAWLPADVVKNTIQNTTQWYRAENRHPMRRHLKSRFPAAHVNHLPDMVSYDTIFSDTPAGDYGVPGHAGCTKLQLFYAKPSQFVYGVPLGRKSDVPGAVKDFICFWGAPAAFLSDSAKENQSEEIRDIEKPYNIGNHHYSETGYQNQNWIERKILDVKNMVNNVMDITGTPPQYWLLCTLYIIAVLQIISQPTLGGMSSLQKITGYIQDSSQFINFHWWQPVYYLDPDPGFPSESKGKLGRWVGIADNTGDFLTYQVLTDDTKQVINVSDIRPVTERPNIRADLNNSNSSLLGSRQTYSQSL